jgi:hypothetical protein
LNSPQFCFVFVQTCKLLPGCSQNSKTDSLATGRKTGVSPKNTQMHVLLFFLCPQNGPAIVVHQSNLTMLLNLEVTEPEISIEGFIFCRYLFKGEIVCISYFDPKTRKWSIAEDFDQPFREIGDEKALQKELMKIDNRLRSN